MKRYLMRAFVLVGCTVLVFLMGCLARVEETVPNSVECAPSPGLYETAPTPDGAAVEPEAGDSDTSTDAGPGPDAGTDSACNGSWWCTPFVPPDAACDGPGWHCNGTTGNPFHD